MTFKKILLIKNHGQGLLEYLCVVTVVMVALLATNLLDRSIDAFRGATDSAMRNDFGNSPNGGVIVE